MQTREKWLAGALAAVLGGWLIVPGVVSAVRAPVDERAADADSLRKIADERGEEELAAIRAAGRLSEWAERALPPDRRAAQSAYQSWLTDLAERCGWSALEVQPLKTADLGEDAATVEVKIEGWATADELARFLDLLTGSGLLQTVVQSRAEAATTDPSEELSVLVRAEAVAMPGGGRRPLPYARFVAGEPTDDGVPVEPPADARGAFDVLTDDGGRLTVAKAKGGVWRFEGDAPAAGAVLRAAPIEADEPAAAEAWTLLAEQGPFAIPVRKPPIIPRLIVDGRVRVVRGDRVDVPVQVVGLPPGEVSLRIEGEAPDGVTLDPDARRLTFATTDETPLGEVVVRLAASGGSIAVDAEATLDVRRPNNAPVIAEADVPEAYPGREWRLPIEARDPDGDELTLSLDGPDGAVVGDGAVVWTPGEDDEGETVSITVTASDAADEPMSAARTFEVPVAFDAEGTTELVGSVRIDGEPAALLIDRRTGARLVAREGQELSVGRMRATVAEIGDRAVTLSEDGEEKRLKLGQAVADRRPGGA